MEKQRKAAKNLANVKKKLDNHTKRTQSDKGRAAESSEQRKASARSWSVPPQSTAVKGFRK